MSLPFEKIKSNQINNALFDYEDLCPTGTVSDHNCAAFLPPPPPPSRAATITGHAHNSDEDVLKEIVSSSNFLLY